MRLYKILNEDGRGKVKKEKELLEVLLQVSQNSRGNNCVRVSFLIKLQVPTSDYFWHGLKSPKETNNFYRFIHFFS